jgi:hypothetical protein
MAQEATGGESTVHSLEEPPLSRTSTSPPLREGEREGDSLPWMQSGRGGRAAVRSEGVSVRLQHIQLPISQTRPAASAG